MMILVTGGSGSGKSKWAEDLVASLAPDKRVYIATMMSFDEETNKRIERHRRQRADKQFITIECFTHLASVFLEQGSTVLLECMSNLAANELYCEEGAGTLAKAEILRGIKHLKSVCKHVVIVTNEVFSDGSAYDEETKRYRSLLGEVNTALASFAERVVEVVYTIPLYLKGEPI